MVPSSVVPSSPDVFVSLDAASTGRLGELAVLLERAGTSVVVDHHASNPGFGDVRLVDGHAPATVVLVADLLDELGVTARPPAGDPALRGPGRRHRLLPLRQHPTRHPRARRPAAGDRHRPLRHQPAAVRHRAVRLAGPAVGRDRPRRPRARGGRRTGLDLVQHRRGRRARPARRAARGAGRRRPLHRGGGRRLRAQGAGRRLVVGVAALPRRDRPRARGHRPRAAAGTRWPPATAPTSTARRPSRPCVES